MCRVFIGLLLALSLLPPAAEAAPAARLWPRWEASEEANPAHIDHSLWQEFLDRYVTPDATGVNLVAYDRVEADDRHLLQTYLRALAQLDPRDYARAEQLPYWVNLYNALTVEIVLAHPGKDSILRMGRGFFSVGPWNDEVITIAAQPITLNDIEHRILRPIWKDRRIHYALNCASVSCPNLNRAAYTRANIEQALAANEIAYVNHPRGVRLDADGELVLSRIYEWYATDFADDRAGLLDYLGGLHVTLGGAIRAYRGPLRYVYDWGLNEPATSAHAGPPGSQ